MTSGGVLPLVGVFMVEIGYFNFRRRVKLSVQGGKNAKKRAVVAVARKLAVLLHRLWVSGEAYEPLRNSQKAMTAAA